MESKKEMVVGLPAGCVMTLKELTDLISVDHSKAMKKVVKLEEEDGFGRLAKMASHYVSGNGATKTIPTYALTETQSIACGARLNNTLLMRVIKRVKELEAPKLDSTRVVPAIDLVEPTLRMLKALGIEENFAKFHALEYSSEISGVDLSGVKKFVSEYAGIQEPKETTYTATQLGQQITIFDKKGNKKHMSAIAINKKLISLGLLLSVGVKKDLTEKGKEFGVKIPFEKNGHSGYQIEWKLGVLDLIK